MKKAFVLLICLFITYQGISQGLDLGVKAGVNFANITDASGLNNRTGFVAGVFVGGKLSEKVGLQGDVLYSQQGAELDLGDFNLNYINIPVVVKYYLFKGLNAQIGPQFGLLIDDETRTVVGEVINDIAVNNFDFSGVLGLGFELPLGLRFEGRYVFGLSDVAKSFDSRNSVVTLSVGLTLL